MQAHVQIVAQIRSRTNHGTRHDLADSGNFPSRPPAPRKKRVRQEIVVRSEYGSQQGVFEEYAEETGTEEVGQREADRHQGL